MNRHQWPSSSFAIDEGNGDVLIFAHGTPEWSFAFFWGMKDKFIPPYELEKWKTKLPVAPVITFDDAGHFAGRKTRRNGYSYKKLLIKIKRREI